MRWWNRQQVDIACHQMLTDRGLWVPPDAPVANFLQHQDSVAIVPELRVRVRTHSAGGEVCPDRNTFTFLIRCSSTGAEFYDEVARAIALPLSAFHVVAQGIAIPLSRLRAFHVLPPAVEDDTFVWETQVILCPAW